MPAHSVQVVTGYVPIPGHTRTAEEYGALGEKVFVPLVQMGVNVKRYMEPLDMCWLHKYVARYKAKPPYPSAGDNPAKNTMAYHCVQHQKFGWLLKAAIEDPRHDTYVWLDYGIGHVPGVDNGRCIYEFLLSIKDDDFAIPGCWPRDAANIDLRTPCWRFCGGTLVVPRKMIHKLYKAVKTTALNHVNRTGNVEWEVNTLARAEVDGLIKPRWYQADHNETMFTGYGNGLQ